LLSVAPHSLIIGTAFIRAAWSSACCWRFSAKAQHSSVLVPGRPWLSRKTAKQ
jgi:hypothetical protein